MSYPEFFSQESNLLLHFLRDNEKNWQFFSLSLKKWHNLFFSDDEEKFGNFSSSSAPFLMASALAELAFFGVGVDGKDAWDNVRIFQVRNIGAAGRGLGMRDRSLEAIG